MNGVSVKLRADRVSSRSSSSGWLSSWNRIAGPPSSRARNATAAASPAPAACPPTAIRAGSTPSSAACSAVQTNAA